MNIGYYIRTDIQHIPPVIRLYKHLGGTIFTKTEKIYKFLLDKYGDLNPEIYLVKNSSEARGIARKKDIKIIVYTGFQMMHWGYSVQIFHGTSDKTYIEDKRILKYDKLLLPGERIRDKIKKAGFFKHPERFILTGYAKFDDIVNKKVDYTPVFDNGKPTILYAPTWISQGSGSKLKFSPYGESSLPIWSKGLVKAISSKWNLIIKYHSRINPNIPGIYQEIDDYIEQLGVQANVKALFDDDITVYMDQADIMISDISAVCYEWFHFNRPIVFANPAPEHYKPSDDAFSNTYSWTAGDVLYTEEQIVPTIEKNLERDDYKEIRNRLFHYAFYKPDGKATQRQVRAIKELYDEVSNKNGFYLLFRNIPNMLR